MILNEKVYRMGWKLAKKAVVAFAAGELAGRVVSLLNLGVNVSNYGLFVSTTPISMKLLSLVVKRLGNETLKNYLEEDSSNYKKFSALVLSFCGLRLAGISVSPIALGASMVTAFALNYLSKSPPRESYWRPDLTQSRI